MNRFQCFFSICLITLWSVSFGSQIDRTYKEAESGGEQIKYIDFTASFKLDLKLPIAPISAVNKAGKSVWLFEFNLQNNLGIEVDANHLKENDFLLSDLKTIGGDDGSKGVVLVKKNTYIKNEDLIYVNGKNFRTMYETSGKPMDTAALKVGQTFEAYKRSYDEESNMFYEESGLQTSEGEVLIPNGTTLEPKHIAMILRKAVLPVRVQYKITPDLEFFLRKDWPKEAYQSKERFWILRNGEPLYLLRYQLNEGDTLLGDIILPDKSFLGKAESKLVKKGDINSIETITARTDAFMVAPDSNLPIRSIDPISLMPNAKIAEPSDLIIAPQNEFEFDQPYFLKNEDELNNLLRKGNFSYSKSHLSKPNTDFPYSIYLTRYSLPFNIECVSECDELLDITASVMKGTHHCPQCKRTKHFPPYVEQPTSVFTHLDYIWEKEKITCAYCEKRFFLSQAYSTAGSRVDGADYGPISVNFTHPKDLIADKSIPKEEILYYMNGDEIAIEADEPVDQETIDILKERAVSPVFLSEPTELKSDAAQCPFCFGWNTKPLSPYQIRSPLGRSEVRRGAVSFKNTGTKVNRLDLVIFGLDRQIEPTSGRPHALVATYERYGDEHFQFIAGWKLKKIEWKYLARYDMPINPSLPISAMPGVGNSDGDDDELIDDL